MTSWKAAPGYLKAAAASVIISLSLLAVRFAAPAWPLAPLVVANWLAFMATVYLASRSIRWQDLARFRRPEQAKGRTMQIALIAFAGAGWTVILTGGRIG